jgi:glycolate dehydrogenase FAD-binding subunit
MDAAEVAAALREARGVRIVSGGTKLGWGRPIEAPELTLSELDAIVAHNEGDFTAILQAGVPLATAQDAFATAGQMLALDPPDDGATIGGVVATGDSGPLRHRYGAPRDLVLGVQVALPDGSLARAGSKVIKNVAGYDLAKLMTGAFGTLGVVTEVSVRLHPRPRQKLTVVIARDDPRALASAASELAHRPVEAERLDVRWEDGAGSVLVQLTGPSAPERAAALDGDVVEDDDTLWAAQRAAQRGPVVLRVSSTQQGLGDALAAADEHGAVCVARAALGLAWLRLEAADAALVDELRTRLGHCVLLDAPAALRAEVDPWGTLTAEPLMRRVKARFDPHDTLNPGLVLTPPSTLAQGSQPPGGGTPWA